MRLFEDWDQDFIQFWDDECEGLTEEECNDIKNVVDVSFILARLECSYQDMEDVIGMLAELFNGERNSIDYICSNGGKIKIALDQDGKLVIETDPPLDEDEIKD